MLKLRGGNTADDGPVLSSKYWQYVHESTDTILEAYIWSLVVFELFGI